ncbi:MAG: DUF1801 domain-containing protein [Rhodoferax sp.]|nr:DUF1801 domain-containing protein [Rhodoferax sp.]
MALNELSEPFGGVKPSVPTTVDDYISGFPEDVRAVLSKVRETVCIAAPEAEEIISYRMPALRQKEVLIYFAAFKNHIGFYPPVKGDADLEQMAARYANAKGNLRFPFAEPIPYELISRLTALRVAQIRSKTATMAKKTRNG